MPTNKDEFNNSIREIYYTPVALSPQVAQIFDFLPTEDNLLINPARLKFQNQNAEAQKGSSDHVRTRSTSYPSTSDTSSLQKRDRSSTYPTCTLPSSNHTHLLQPEEEHDHRYDDDFEHEWENYCKSPKEHKSVLNSCDPTTKTSTPKIESNPNRLISYKDKLRKGKKGETPVIASTALDESSHKKKTNNPLKKQSCKIQLVKKTKNMPAENSIALSLD